MTPIEKMERIMKHSTWDEAEQIGIEILARCMALHIYARKEGGEYIEKLAMKLMLKISTRADEWAHEDNVPGFLALASIGHKMQMREDGEE